MKRVMKAKLGHRTLDLSLIRQLVFRGRQVSRDILQPLA